MPTEPPSELKQMTLSLTERLVNGIQSDSIPSLPINVNEGEFRTELRRSLLQILRKRRTDLTPDQWSGVWATLDQLFDGFEDEIAMLESAELYSVISSVRGSLSDHRIRKSFSSILGAIGETRCIEIFGFRNAIRDGIAILAELITDSKIASIDHCVDIVISSLMGRLHKMTNTTGAVDQVSRNLLEHYLSHCSTTPDQLGLLITSILFHKSMKNQYYRYLEAYGENICLDGGKEVSLTSCPSVSVFFGVLEGIKDDQNAIGHFPLLLKEFIERIPCYEKDSEINSYFLFFAKVLRLLMESTVESRMTAVLDCVEILKLNGFYKHTSDPQRWQLKFLESVTQFVFTKSRPVFKKRRLDHSLETKFHLEFCQKMLEIEHRVLLPFIDQIMKLLINETQFEELVFSFVKVYGSVRQLRPVLISLANNIDSRVFQSMQISNQITTAVREMTNLESLELIRAFCDIQQTEANITVLQSVLDGLVIYDSTSLELAETLHQLLPSLESLQVRSMEDQESYIELLKLSLSIHKSLENCAGTNPAVSKASLEVEKLPVLSHEVYIEFLLLRLQYLYRQSLESIFNSEIQGIQEQGEMIVCCLETVVHSLEADLRTKLEFELLNISFLNELIQRNPEIIQNLFSNPIVYSMSKFRDGFRNAYFTELVRLAPSDSVKVLFNEEVSFKQRSSTLRLILAHRLQNKAKTEDSAISGRQGFLQWIKFGLQLPTEYFQKDRILLEMATLHYSTLVGTSEESIELLECLSLFSLESIYPHKHLGYLRSALFYILQFCKSCFLSKPEFEILNKSEGALFAVLKQFLYQQWSYGDSKLLNNVSICSRKPWKKQQITSKELLQALMNYQRPCPLERSFSVSSMSVFVRLCTWCCLQRQQKGLKCFSGPLPISWSADMIQKIKCKNSTPDLVQLMSILRTTVLPWVKSTTKSDTELSPLDLNLLSGLSCDLLSLLCSTPDDDLEVLIQLLLTRIHSAAKKEKLDVQGSDRIACLIHSASVLAKIDQQGRVGLGFTELHFSVLMSLHSGLKSHQESILENTKGILLKSLDSLLIKINQEDLGPLIEYLVQCLRKSRTLEAKSNVLQCIRVLLKRIERGQKLTELLQDLYTAFWDDYFRHVLLTFVNRENRKTVVMPKDEQSSLFASVLSGFYQCFALCHEKAETVNQTITIHILKHTKRLIEGLYNRGKFMDNIGWFCEACEFMKQTVKRQKSKKAVKELSGALKSAISTILQVLIIRQNSMSEQNDNGLTRLAEVKLNMVLTDIAILPKFRDTVHHVLIVYFKVLENLKTKKFSRRSPFLKYFTDNGEEVELEGKLAKVSSKVSIILSKLSQTQMTKLKTRLNKSRIMTQEMQVLMELNRAKMERRESVETNPPVQAMKTPLKKTEQRLDQSKPETFNVSHITDSLDKHRLAGLTYSAKTVHPVHRNSESLCPTPGICGTPYSGATEVTVDPHGLEPVSEMKVPPSPLMPSPLPVHTPVHAPFPRSSRQTIVPKWVPSEDQLQSGRPSTVHEASTPVSKSSLVPPDSPETTNTIHSGTVAGRLMAKLLDEEAKKESRQTDANDPKVH
eukprot:g4889.t1